MSPTMETPTAIFSKRVRDFMRDVPPAVAEGTPLGEAAQRMESAGAQKQPRAPDHE